MRSKKLPLFKFISLLGFFVQLSSVIATAITPSVQQAVVPAPVQQSSAEDNNIYRVGNGVSIPKMISSKLPQTSAIRIGKQEIGSAQVTFIVEKDGSTSNVHLLRIKDSQGKAIADPENSPTGKDLAQKTIEAVTQYRFQPATKKGNPVRVSLLVEVQFQITN